MKIILIIVMALCLLGTVPMMWLGVAYVDIGQGLHPALSVLGVLALIATGWQAACMFDAD